MIWSIETDDFNGVCGEDYPLLRAINRAINNYGPELTTDATTTEAPSNSTTEPSPTFGPITTSEPETTTPEPDTTTPEPDNTTPEPDTITPEPDTITSEPGTPETPNTVTEGE